jgi:hypothetical protein
LEPDQAKVSKLHLETKLCGGTHLWSLLLGSGGRRILTSDWSGKVGMTPYLKNKLEAKDWGTAQVEQHLPCKCEALISAPLMIKFKRQWRNS